MTNYKEVQNLETGAIQWLFNAKLINIGDKVLKNANKKEYKIVTLGFHLPSGEKVNRSAMCYEANYANGIEEGNNYLCNLTFSEQGEPHINMSHIQNADRASMKDFVGLFQAQEQFIDSDCKKRS